MTLFINDYSEGCHERILEALTRTNRVQTTGYGTDPYCAEARDILRREMACPDADIWFLSGGTQTNLIALTAALRPHEAVIGAATPLPYLRPRDRRHRGHRAQGAGHPG